MSTATPDTTYLIGRLANWKFASAAARVDINSDAGNVVQALSRQFGDCGWFDGDMGTIVGYLVDAVIKDLGGDR